MPRPDQSQFLAHFTKDGSEFIAGNLSQNPSIAEMSALQRLIHILEDRQINATNMNWTDEKAVCFTECPWGSLLRHAAVYSPYGIGFTKRLIYSRKGNPVIYANPSMFKAQNWTKEVRPFLTPFVPSYAPNSIKQQAPFNGKYIDYTHEREWRVTKDFKFTYPNVQFVILDKVSDLQEIPDSIINEVGVEKFLFMDAYRRIEELWPTHMMD